MHYQIALPINLKKLYIYRSDKNLVKGIRVFVSFQHRFLTGIVWNSVNTPDKRISYKSVLEVIDQKPKIPNELLELANWMNRYYQCSLGLTLAAMLPTAFNVQSLQKVKKEQADTSNLSKSQHSLLAEISHDNWRDIKEIKESVKSANVYENLEELENNGYISIKRTFDSKIKKIVANYVILKKIQKLPELSDKQNKVYNELQELGKEFPLAKIAKKYTYYILKVLRKKGLLDIVPREVKSKMDIFPDKREHQNITLNQEQKKAFQEVQAAQNKDKFKTFLLHGITGSGKTEVYIKAIKETLKEGKTALMLVPEISLTPQMVKRFYNAFGRMIAILHSHLNDREKWLQWKKIKSKESKIVIGARSAIFAPLENIGIIIVDEEHETSYKQEKHPRYNGRDIAILRAKLAGAVTILGSATPSLESWQNALDDKYQLLSLKKRPIKSKLPHVDIIDMRKRKEDKDLISKELKLKIEQKLEANEQIILLQNRRGHSSFVQCVNCGKLFKCDNCDISLKFHSKHQELICHYCGSKQKMPRKCPDCGSYKFRFGTAGTQQIEKQLKIIFPQAKILRMDSDTTNKKDSYDTMFEKMSKGNIDILLGTQMIAKGLDFPNVTLVGVVSADIGLNIPDFRAAERTFQLLTQVAGRSGRGNKEGEVVIQTYNPDHYAIKLAMQQDFQEFAHTELALRKTLKYPPFYKLARFVFSYKKEKYLRQQVYQNKKMIDQYQKNNQDNLKILGPIQAPMLKLNRRYRYHIIIKAKSVQDLSKAINYIKARLNLPSGIRITLDIDPYSLL